MYDFVEPGFAEQWRADECSRVGRGALVRSSLAGQPCMVEELLKWRI